MTRLTAPRSRVWRWSWITRSSARGSGTTWSIRSRSAGWCARGGAWQGGDGIEPFFTVEVIEPEHRFAFRWSPDDGVEGMTLVEFLLEEARTARC